MGLDMYLTARKDVYVGKHIDESKGKIKCELPKELKMFEDVWHENLNVTTSYTIGYWRKANAIHKWFVDNCGGGEDNCQDMYISKEDIENLLEVCKEVLAEHGDAENKLPTQDGFFFGGTEYDEYYFDDLEYTRKVCEATLKFLEEKKKDKDEGYLWEIHYQASW